MSYVLDGIIKRLSPTESDEPPARSEKRFIYDAKKDVFLDKRPFVTLGRDLHDYAIRTRRPVECCGPSCRVRSIKKNSYVDFQIDYEAWCQAGEERKLISKVHNGDHPAQVVDQLLEEELEAFVLRERERGHDFILDFYDLREDLEKAIADGIKNELGLSIAPTVRPRLEEKLETKVVDIGHFEARPKNSDMPVVLECSTEAEIADDGRMLAMLHYDKTHNLTRHVQGLVSKALADEISLQELAQELLLRRPSTDGTPSVENRLIARINEDLSSVGRKVRYLRLRAPELEEIEPIKVDHLVVCSIRECEDDIIVQHRLILSPFDLGSIQKSGVKSPEEWIKNRLEWVTNTLLFEKTYLDLLLDFDADEIKRVIIEEAGTVGYAVQQMITIPDLEPLTWKDGIMVECGKKRYSTRDSRIEVRLEVVVSGRITDLENERLGPYLNPKSHRIFKDIEKAVKRETQRVMHTIDAERFYMRFQSTDIDSEPPVVEVLEIAIAKLLREQFAFSEVSVIPKPLETELTQRLSKLLNGPHSLSVECIPLRSGGRREVVEFNIEFNILGVSRRGWHIFCSKKFVTIEDELERIKNVMRNEIKSRFETIPAEKLQYVDRKNHLQLAEIVTPCQKKILFSFGLEIDISNIYRGATKGELDNLEILEHDIDVNKDVGKKAAIKAGDAALGKLDQLHEKEQELLAAGIDEDDPVLEDVRNRIREINDEILPFRSREERDHVPALPAGSYEFSVEDYHRELLPELSARKLLVEGDEEEGE